MIRGSWCRGAQYAVRNRRGSICRGVVGASDVNVSFDSDTLHKVWCCTKPALALGILDLVYDGVIALDDAVGDVVSVNEMSPVVQHLTLRELLNHGTFLVEPSLAEILMRDERSREERLKSVLRSSDVAGTGYSEFTAWSILAMVQRTATGLSTSDWVNVAVLGRYNLQDQIYLGMSSEQFLRNRSRIGVYFGFTDENPDGVPWLHDRTRFAAGRLSSPVLGGYATASGLASLYRVLIDHPVFASELRDFDWSNARRFDCVYEQYCEFFLGLMIKMPEHGFGAPLGWHSLGHAGWLGSSVVWQDLDLDVTVAIVLNGVMGPVNSRAWPGFVAERIRVPLTNATLL